MSTYTNILDENLGERHRKFRTTILRTKQSELAEKRGLSQSTISNFDRGQMPNKEYLDFMAERGCNLHWFLTGNGNMEYNGIENLNDTVSSKEDVYKWSTEPLPTFLKHIDPLREQLINILPSPNKELEKKIVLTIIDRTDQLKKNYGL